MSTLQTIRIKALATEIFKTFHSLNPIYMNEIFQTNPLKTRNLEGVEGGPLQDDGPGLIFHCGRRPIFTMVEGPWPNTTQKARVSFNVHNDRRSFAVTVSHFSIQLGVLGHCKPPKWVQGRALVRVQGVKAPEALRTLHFTVPDKRLKTGRKALSYYGAFLAVL